MKKILIFMLATVLSLQLVNPSFAAIKSKNGLYLQDAQVSFRNMRPETKNEVLGELKIMVGTDKGFEGNKNLTKAEVATIVYNIAKDENKENQAEKIDLSVLDKFKDVDKNSWYASQVAYSVSKGIINGNGEGAFEPNKECSGIEATIMLSRALMESDKVKELKYPDDYQKIYADMNGNTDNIFKTINRNSMSNITFNMLATTEVLEEKIKNNERVLEILNNEIEKTEEKENTRKNEEVSIDTLAKYNKDDKELEVKIGNEVNTYKLDSNTQITIAGNHGGKISLDELGDTVRQTKVDVEVKGNKVSKLKFLVSQDVMRKTRKIYGIVTAVGKTSDDNYETSYDIMSSEGEEVYYSEDEGYIVGDIIEANVTSDVMVDSEKLDKYYIDGAVYNFNSNNTIKVLCLGESSVLSESAFHQFDIGKSYVLDVKEDMFFIEAEDGEYKQIDERDIKTLPSEGTLDASSVFIFLKVDSKTDELVVIGITKMADKLE